MAKVLPRHFLDASVIGALIKREEIDDDRRWWYCQQLVEQAERGGSILVISGVTFAEVTGGKGKARTIPGPNDDRNVMEVVRAFFENEYIEVVEVERAVGEITQRLIWDLLTLDTLDAIHLASALFAGCDFLSTDDTGLLKLVKPGGHFTNPELQGRAGCPRIRRFA